jgi:uncharacterized protein
MNGGYELSQHIKDEFVGVSHGDLKRFKELLSKYPGLATVTASWGETPIEAAAQMVQREMIEMLLAAGAPLDICTAAVMGMEDLVKAMLDDDPGLKDATGAHGIPVMYFPVVGGYQSIAEILLAAGADVNAGEGGNAPLHGAAMFGRTQMAKWLISHGANVNGADYEGKTPLKIALAHGDEEMARILREHGGVEQIEEDADALASY